LGKCLEEVSSYTPSEEGKRFSLCKISAAGTPTSAAPTKRGGASIQLRTQRKLKYTVRKSSNAEREGRLVAEKFNKDRKVFKGKNEKGEPIAGHSNPSAHFGEGM